MLGAFGRSCELTQRKCVRAQTPEASRPDLLPGGGQRFAVYREKDPLGEDRPQLRSRR